MLAVTAFAQEDECILDAVTPLLERADSVKRTGKNEITEARKEKSVAYTVTQGGCAHYGVTFSFADWAPRKDESLLQEAARLMRGVKLKKDKQYLVEGIVRLLEANAKSKYTSGDTLPNPDHSDINVSVEGDKIGGYKRIVKVIYSQVL
jgi:Fe-S cluster assembly iron-binding protein IscA